MGLLDKVKSDKRQMPPSIVMYGGPGVGKTTVAMDAPGVVFISTDLDATKQRGGANRLPIATSRSDIFDQINALINDEHDYKTLCIDDLSGVSNLFEKSVCDEYHKNHIDEVKGGWGKGQRFTADVFISLINKLDELRVKRNMAVILIAHAEIKPYNNPEGESYDRSQLELHKYYSESIVKWCDILAFARTIQYTSVKNEETAKEHHIGVGKGERVFMMDERPAYKAKSRYNHAPEIEMSWAAIAEGIK